MANLSSKMSQVGFPLNVCPEILYRQPYDLKCDIFSLWYTMFFVMTGDTPTKTDNFGNRVKNIISNAFQMHFIIFMINI